MNNNLMSSAWTNFIEVRAYGLMRSGNHAIIEWVQNQHSDHITCFLNNIKHGNHDPFYNYKLRVLTGIDEQINVEDLRVISKRLLIYSYEDRQELEANKEPFLDSVFQQSFEENRQCYLGSSRHQIDLLIIRDPFNFLASRLKLLQERGALGGVSNPNLIMENWKILAKEAVRFTQEQQPGKIVANYNRWVSDVDYRRQLSQLLMGTFNDSSIKNISRFGGGSSFREPEKLTIDMIISRWKKLFNIQRYANFNHYWKRFTSPNHEKKVFERWKYFFTNDQFRKLLNDNEVLDLSEKLFGEIPGTREFVKNMQN